MTSTCKDSVELLLGYLDGELTAEVRAGLEAHLEGCSPFRDFLKSYRATPTPCRKALARGMPDEVEAEIMATIDAVAAGPPPQFRGGLRYQPMRGDMSGWFEVRTKYQKRLYRLFCLQDRKAPGLPGPALVMVIGGDKPTESAFSKAFYKRVRALGDEYLASDPRSVA